MKIEPIKNESSLERVQRAAKLHGVEIKVIEMDQSTRTAQEAADACGCEVGQIVKSLIFERVNDGSLVLVLVSGRNNADLEVLARHFGSSLDRADPRKVREQTGFAIGGVAPIGHLCELPVVADKDLGQYQSVWAAAGKPNAVFEINFEDLRRATNAEILQLARQ